MNVKVGFSTSSWWVSRLIRRFTRSRVSHAFLLLSGVEIGDLVLEAEWCGWKLSTKRALTRGTTHVVTLIDPKVSIVDAAVSSLDWLDEPYNYVGLVGMALVCVGRWLRKRWRNPFRSSRSMFCSEGVVYVLQAAKYPGADALDPQSVSPDDLLTFLETGEAAAT